MIQDIKNGLADGILCWKLDRLARNPVDAGIINWMLQQKEIRHIQTHQKSYKPEDNTLMMSLEFGMANQFVLDLSSNTKRGLKNKAEEGWFPHKPPAGYLTNKHKLPNLLPIYEDEENFLILKKLWDKLMHESCSLESLYDTSIQLGLKTNSGKIIKRSAFYDIFRNPFYYGAFKWKGELYVGKHKAMITKQEFNLVQTIIDSRTKPLKKRHIFAYTNLIRCGECGASITAEKKIKHQKNGNQHTYTYYRCTKRVKTDCSQKPITEHDLEEQALTILDRIEIPTAFHNWAMKQLKKKHEREQQDRNQIIESYQKRLKRCIDRLDNLFNMRLSEEITEQEYRTKKIELINEKSKYEELISDSNLRIETWLDRAESLFLFAETAKREFKCGSPQKKRQILSCLGSNLILEDRNLIVKGDKKIAILNSLAPEVRTTHSRLEPVERLVNKGIVEKKYGQNQKVGA